MRVDRLAIIGVMGQYDIRNKETEAGVYALLDKYRRRYPDMPFLLACVKLGPTKNATEWNSLEDEVVDSQSMDFDNSAGTLGVYVLAHGSHAGLDGVADEAKFYVMLKHFNLLSMRKLCLVACASAGEAIQDGHVVGNPSTLYRLCSYLGAKGRDCKPVMAGWNSFVTIVNEEMFKTKKDDAQSMTLGEWKSSKSGNILAPAQYVGKKALSGPRGEEKILASNPKSKKETKKLYYMYQDGAMRVTYADWTDK